MSTAGLASMAGVSADLMLMLIKSTVLVFVALSIVGIELFSDLLLSSYCAARSGRLV